MALQKTITLPSGATGSYIRAAGQRYDPILKEFSCFVLLYTSEAHRIANEHQPLATIGKLRVTGDDFTTYLAPSVYDLEQVYVALKALPLTSGLGMPEDILHDAESV